LPPGLDLEKHIRIQDWSKCKVVHNVAAQHQKLIIIAAILIPILKYKILN